MKAKALVLATLLMMACGRGYSKGERSGKVYKFSQKGLLFKSWEGEMLLGQSTGGDVWAFTVTDPALVPQVQRALETGEPVLLGYMQWFQSGCGMDTDYEIDGVLPVGAAK